MFRHFRSPERRGINRRISEEGLRLSSRVLRHTARINWRRIHQNSSTAKGHLRRTYLFFSSLLSNLEQRAPPRATACFSEDSNRAVYEILLPQSLFVLYALHYRRQPRLAHLPERQRCAGPHDSISVCKPAREGFNRGLSDPAQGKREDSPQTPRSSLPIASIRGSTAGPPIPPSAAAA